MIKTLRITTIVAAILAVIIFSLPLVFGGRGNEEMEKFLNSASVVEKFKQTEGSRAKTGTSQISPLVKQAEAFALYLNPPKPKPPPTLARQPRVSPPAPKAPVTAKFTLVGTSVYQTNPQLSLAFINESGKGLHWVRQGTSIGHLTIEQVKDGLIVVRDSQRTYEVAVPVKPQRSLLQDSSPVSTTGRSHDSSIPEPAVTAFNRTNVATTRSTPPPPSTEEVTMIEQFMKSIQENIDSGQEDSHRLEEFIEGLGSMRISDDEAKKLKNLPEELDAQHSPGRLTADPNQANPQGTSVGHPTTVLRRSRKVEKPTRPPKDLPPRR